MAIVKAFDTSRWNHPNDEPIDFELAFQVTPPDENGYRIWSGRASVGNYYIDPWFARDFDAARAAGFICVPYHVTTPEYPDNLQVDKFIQALDGRIPDGVVIDAELHRDQTPIRVTACNRYHAERFSQMFKRVLFYTNASFGNTYLLSNFGLPLFVANPGPGGGMNTNPAPALPRLWNGFIAWQKDWKHAIPGVPDTTNDYSEFQMSEAEARAYFGMDESEEDMSEIIEKLDLILENQGIIIAMLDGDGGEEPPVVPPVVPPPPVEPPAYYVRVTVPKANARFSKANNANGLPIMQIYPSDSSPVSERIQFQENVLLRVSPDKVRADGGGYYYLLLDWEGRNDEDLYLRDQDCIKTW
jgi:GH25 family lysozyme M1 (1,4-beta-N-acetylmuramidase)